MNATELKRTKQRFDDLSEKIQNITISIPNETDAQQRKRVKDLQKDYLSWFEFYFPLYATCKSAPFHKKIAEIIIKNPICFLLNDAFRGSAKSVHTMLGLPIYLALVKKELYFMLLIGENEDKAVRLLSDIQVNLQYNKRIINDYGEQFKHGDWAEGNFTTRSGVHFHALGFMQDPRGLRFGEHRPDYIGCDDIDTLRRCNNDRLIREAVDYITGTLWGCFDKGRERFVYNNNLIHKNSILAKLIEQCHIANKEAKKEGSKTNFFHIKTKAILDENFTPTWSDKYTADYWRKKFASMPYRAWMREYMCTPLQDGAIFDAKTIQYAKMLPYSQYDALCLYGDLSYKDKGDYKAMVLVGKKGKFFHVIHAFCRQTSRANCATWLYDLYYHENLEKYNIHYLAEGLFAQDEFIGDFDFEGDRRGYYVPIVADKEQKGNKYDRIESMSGYFERLNVFFNENSKEDASMVALIDQLLAFEKGSDANDDGPDALQSAIAFLNKSTFISNFEIKKIKRTQLQKNRF
jgi:predicted phage terminase large subunit-like protein